jgi:plastocyanin
MRRLALALLWLALASDSRSGEVSTVHGKIKLLQRGLFGGMHESDDKSGVLVYVTGYSEAPPSDPAELVQENERFAPRILPIVAGQKVTFPNHDRFYHNVFSVSPVSPFDLGQYKSSDAPRSHSFAEPGLVPVYCNIHPQMISYVVVLENRAYGLSGEDGSFELHNVRPGRVTLNAWTPGAQRVTRELELRAGESSQVELELSRTQTIPSHLRKDGTPYPTPPSYGSDP